MPARSGFRAWRQKRVAPRHWGQVPAPRQDRLRDIYVDRHGGGGDRRHGHGGHGGGGGGRPRPGGTGQVPPITPVPTVPPGQSAYNQPITSNGSFFDPNSQYGTTQPLGGVANSPIGDIFLEDNPDAAWLRFTTSRGFDPMTERGQLARGLLPMARTGWNAALATNPQLRQRDYLESLDLTSLINNMTQAQRGERPGQFAPRARTISRGYG